MNARVKDLERAAELERMTDEELREHIRRKHQEQEPRGLEPWDAFCQPDRLFR